MTWISVKDKLPKKHRQVLAIDANGEITVCLRSAQNEWVYMGCYDGCCKCSNGNVTHWMELPDAPA